MGEFDLEAMVLDVIRKQTGQPSAGPRSRFEEDLGLSDNGRKALFAFLVEAFAARGLNLPARGFYQSNFLTCATPAQAQEAIREALSGVKKKPAGAGTAPAKPPAAAPVATPAAAPIAAGAGKVPNKKSATRGAKSGGKTKSKPKAPGKKKAPARKGRGGR